MSEEKRQFAMILKRYFGLRDGDSNADFVKEMRDLSEEDKIQLADGIEDGTLTY